MRFAVLLHLVMFALKVSSMILPQILVVLVEKIRVTALSAPTVQGLIRSESEFVRVVMEDLCKPTTK